MRIELLPCTVHYHSIGLTKTVRSLVRVMVGKWNERGFPSREFSIFTWTKHHNPPIRATGR